MPPKRILTESLIALEEHRLSMRPTVLDLFCGAGGASLGYFRAGFNVVGVDKEPQPKYPFRFIQADALEFLEELLSVGPPSHQFDAIHASPPCQDYSRALRHMADKQPRLIDPVRDLLVHTGLPWVIENVEGSPLPRAETLDGRYGLELCGTMFGLRIGWHRLFQANFPLYPSRGSCRCDSSYVINPHNGAGRTRIYDEFGPGDPEAVWRVARGTVWMGRYEAREAIPPVYTKFIGRQILDLLDERYIGAAALEAFRKIRLDLVDGGGTVVGEFDVEMGEDGAGHSGLLSVDPSDSPKPASSVKDGQ